MSLKFNFCEVYREIYSMCRMIRPLDDASLERYVPWLKRPLDTFLSDVS
jgi:hypothetical protein